VRGLVSREAARLGEGDRVQQERADALEACLRLAEPARQAREVAKGLPMRLDRLTGALLEAERLGCRCDPDAGLVCRMHALVKKALDGGGAGIADPG
jgi:hypothetical protein